jgi:hypothetical protein
MLHWWVQLVQSGTFSIKDVERVVVTERHYADVALLRTRASLFPQRANPESLVPSPAGSIKVGSRVYAAHRLLVCSRGCPPDSPPSTSPPSPIEECAPSRHAANGSGVLPACGSRCHRRPRRTLYGPVWGLQAAPLQQTWPQELARPR